MVNSDAVFDVLEVASFMSRTRSGVTAAELHSLTYLACLASVFDGRDPTWWRYVYTSTEVGAPFAVAVEDAIERLVATGALEESADLFRVSQRGHAQLAVLRDLPSMSLRERYVSAACSATLTMPLPLLTEAVTREPQLRTAVRLNKSRPLLDLTGLDVLTPHFDGVRQVLAESLGASEATDLLVPVSLWLAYLIADDDAA